MMPICAPRLAHRNLGPVGVLPACNAGSTLLFREVLMKARILSLFAVLFIAAAASAQDVAPPTPQRLDIHSKVLNEDRVIWVRVPPGYQQSKEVYPVVYQTDAPGHVNEIGGTIDFLVTNGRMPQLIVVGIANTDRVRDLTPSRPGLEERRR